MLLMCIMKLYKMSSVKLLNAESITLYTSRYSKAPFSAQGQHHEAERRRFLSWPLSQPCSNGLLYHPSTRRCPQESQANENRKSEKKEGGENGRNLESGIGTGE